VKFYDEREWRVVPSVEGEELKNQGVDIFDDEDTLHALHESLEQYALKVQTEDVRYIIIKSDSEVKTLEELLYSYQSFEDYEIDSLLTKIIRIDAIKEDM
jgi:hypothetical protein